VKFIKPYNLFESSGSSNNSKLILKLFREYILRQKNIDLILNTTGIILRSDMLANKEGANYKPIMKFIHTGGEDYTFCGISMIRYYRQSGLPIAQRTLEECSGIAEYLNDLGDINNDYYERVKDNRRSVIRNQIDISLKCAKGRKMIAKFIITFNDKPLIKIEEKFDCPFKTTSGQYMKQLVSFMEEINKKIDMFTPSVMKQSKDIQDEYYNKLINMVHENPSNAEIIKNYPRVLQKLNQISSNGVTDTSSMLDMGFFD
jgi:hypothetical protein